MIFFKIDIKYLATLHSFSNNLQKQQQRGQFLLQALLDGDDEAGLEFSLSVLVVVKAAVSQVHGLTLLQKKRNLTGKRFLEERNPKNAFPNVS